MTTIPASKVAINPIMSVIRRWPGLQSRPWVKAFLHHAPMDGSIVAIVAIGSAVRDRGHSRSDLDLVVLYTGHKPKLHSPTEVDIRSYDIEKAEALIAAGHEVLGWSIKFGIPLYDPQGIWRNMICKWADKLKLPSASKARDRAIKSLELAEDMLRNGDESAANDLGLASLTQLIRASLIEKGVYPASRPELSDQLRRTSPQHPLAILLDKALYDNADAKTLIGRLRGYAGKTSPLRTA